MKKLKFTELQTAANEFIQLMNDHDGELTPENETLMNLVNDKIDTGFFIVDRVIQEINDINSMIKELTARKKQKQQQLDFISSVVINTCGAMQIKKHESFKVFTIADKPSSVDVFDESLIPVAHKNVKIEIKMNQLMTQFQDIDERIEYLSTVPGIEVDEKESVDKKQILSLLKEGVDVPGCKLKKGKRISIKKSKTSENVES